MNGFQFFETSAITGKNVEEAFVTIAREIYSKIRQGDYYPTHDWEGIKEGTYLALCEPPGMRDSTILKADCGGGGSCC